MTTALDAPNFRLTGKIDSPINLDYDIFGFQKFRGFVKGELIEVKLINSEEDEVVKETRVFTRDENHFVISRQTTIEWFLTDGSVGESKTWIKTYSAEEAIVEGEIRRKNVIDAAKYQMFASVGKLYSFDFLLGVKTQMNYYIDGYTTPLISAINTSTKPYMTIEVKQAIIEILTL